MKNINKIVSLIIVLISYILICTTIWVTAKFDVNNFDAILVTVFSPLDGTDVEVILRAMKWCVLIPFIGTVITGFIIYFFNKTKISNKVVNRIKAIINHILCHLKIYVGILFFLSLVLFMVGLKIDKYISYKLNKSTLYEKYYVDPATVKYEFPETKRNLIFIFAESMETSYYDKQNGGYFDFNLIPELLELSKEGTTFTSLDNQGFYQAPGATWTIGAQIAQTSGTLMGNYTLRNQEKILEEKFLPGAYTLGDILEANNYNNVFMSGTSAVFASTDTYFKSHGNYKIYDYDYAVKQGWIPKDYKVFWGYEDQKLFQNVKKELTKLSKEGEPFNLTFATIDSHPDGYECDLCENKHDNKLYNAISCSSKQINDFVNWVKQQDFYKDTTIVIVGDHISTSTILSDAIDDSFVRKCYFTIINPAIEYNGSLNRTISSLDIFPTTLAAMGIKFNSDRLGLGTNLYSNSPTLFELLGDEFFEQLQMSSDYFDNHIFSSKS